MIIALNWIGISLISLGGFLLIILILVLIIWGNEIKTLKSIKEIMPGNEEDGYVYEMKVHGNYYLDDFVKGGGLKSDQDLIDFLTKKITKGLFKIKIEEPEIVGCTGYAARASNGDAIFARNYDLFKTNVALVHTKPKGRYQSISTVDLRFLGIDPNTKIKGLGAKFNALAAPYAPLDGINEKGLSFGIFMSFQGPGETIVATDQNTGKPDITSTTLLRLMLDNAATIEEAVAIAESYDMHDSANTSFHYMVADANGNSAILEYITGTDSTDIDGSKRKLKVIYKNDPKSLAGTDKYQIITNFIVHPNYYLKGDHKYGYDRYEIVLKELKNRKGIVKSEKDAMSILSASALRNYDNDIKCVTVHSAIYNLTEKTVYWISNRNFGNEKFTFRYRVKK